MINRASPKPQWIADLRTRKMLDANEAALKFWRMTRKQFLTIGVEQFFHGDEVPRWQNYVNQKDLGRERSLEVHAR